MVGKMGGKAELGILSKLRWERKWMENYCKNVKNKITRWRRGSMNKKYRIDFDCNLLCDLVVTENGIMIEGALNGWGDPILLDRIKINELTQTAPATDTGDHGKDS